MLALLKLIPLKDWLWALLLVIVSVAFVSYTVHERHIGQAQIEASDAKAVAVQAAHNKLLENVAVESINVTAQKYHAAGAAPIPDSPHVLVRSVARNPGSVPQTSCSATGTNGAPGVSEDSAGDPSTSIDIGPGLDRVGRDADAEVTALQDIIKAYQELYAQP